MQAMGLCSTTRSEASAGLPLEPPWGSGGRGGLCSPLRGAANPRHNQVTLDRSRLARLEAIFTGVPGNQELQVVLEQLDPASGGTFTWLDPRNASLALLPGTAAVPVQVLLELRGRGELGVMVTSREGMSRGAPLSRGVLEQILLRIRELLPKSRLQYRSDRDGPVEQAAISC